MHLSVFHPVNLEEVGLVYFRILAIMSSCLIVIHFIIGSKIPRHMSVINPITMSARQFTIATLPEALDKEVPIIIQQVFYSSGS